jgi:acyl-CoA synthetase (NDP forming)
MVSAQTKKSLSENASREILVSFGVPVVEGLLAQNLEEAVIAAQKIGFPVALKGNGASFAHKSELGLVRLGLKDAGEVRKAAEEVAAAAGAGLEGFLVQPMVPGGREFVAGLFRDELFGPVIVFGLGGVYAEALKDAALRLAPLTLPDIDGMVEELSSKALLGPFRGEAAVNREELRAVLMGLSRLAMERPEIVEVDLNPLKITPDGRVVAVDALVVTGSATLPEKRTPVAPRDLHKLFYPSSVAIIGASGTLGKWGQFLSSNLLTGGFAGEVYLVNRTGGELYGRKVYTSVSEVPGTVDLAVICIPAKQVEGLLADLKAKNTRYALIISSGFAETGEEGEELQESLVKAAREAGIIFVGPNTMGILNPYRNLFITGVHVRPRPGNTAMLSQSGNMGVQLLRYAELQGVGIRAFCGSGNEAVISVEDFMEGFELDDKTSTVQVYVESVKDGRRFFESARRLCRKKPVILLKGGRTNAGGRAAMSHSGALATDFRLFDSVCRQAGILSVKRPLEMLDTASVFSSLPLPAGRRVAIMTFGGGWGVVTSDLCAEAGLDVADLDEKIIASLDRLLPPYWSRCNPVDLVGEMDPKIPTTGLADLAAWEGCDAILHLGILGQKHLLDWLLTSTEELSGGKGVEGFGKLRERAEDFEQGFLAHIGALMDRYKKPIIGVNMVEGDGARTVYDSRGGSPYRPVVFSTPERAVAALARMCEYGDFLRRG